MKSMTGFARGKFEFDDFSFNISFKSLNHRFLDITFKGTGVTPSSEKFIRDFMKDRVFRGKIEIVFNLFERDPSRWSIQFNESLLGEILDKVFHFEERYRENLSLSLDFLLKIPMVFHIDYNFELFSQERMEKIKNSIEKVFQEFLDSRRQEGEYTLADLLAGLETIDDRLKLLEGEAEKIENEIYQTFQEKIQRFVSDFEIDEKRIAQEAAIVAEKSCVREEINRLAAHSRRLKELLLSKNIDAKGREADFLAQEMQRETHTIASKTNSMEIHREVLLIRREIEKIKQQVQNVE